MFQYFVLGALTVYIILPIIDSILNIILAFLEVIKGCLNLKIAEINKQMTEKENPRERKLTKIGFMANMDPEEVEAHDSEA